MIYIGQFCLHSFPNAHTVIVDPHTHDSYQLFHALLNHLSSCYQFCMCNKYLFVTKPKCDYHGSGAEQPENHNYL